MSETKNQKIAILFRFGLFFLHDKYLGEYYLIKMR